MILRPPLSPDEDYKYPTKRETNIEIVKMVIVCISIPIIITLLLYAQIVVIN